MDAIAVIGAYLACTVPLLAILLKALTMRGAYMGVFIAGLLLQIIPIGLFFFPLGIIGVGILAYSTISASHRAYQLRRLHLDNQDVERLWTLELLLNLMAIGFAVQQKLFAWLFLQVTLRQADLFLLGVLAGISLLWWALIGTLTWREWQQPVLKEYRESNQYKE